MQIDAATLLASQHVAPHASPAAARPAPGFAAALEKTGFEPLPLKQMAHTDESPAAAASPARPARLGANLDIKI